MKRTITIMILAVVMMMTTTPVNANTNDLNLAKAWASEHYTTHDVKVVGMHKAKASNTTIYIERVKTKSIGHKKGKVIGTRYTVKYPKNVKKGKKVTVYMVYDPGMEVDAMVCLGIIKADRDAQVNCPCCHGQDRDCPYWLYDEWRHMTEEEIADFEFLESHYQDENGEWVER